MRLGIRQQSEIHTAPAATASVKDSVWSFSRFHLYSMSCTQALPSLLVTFLILYLSLSFTDVRANDPRSPRYNASLATLLFFWFQVVVVFYCFFKSMLAEPGGLRLYARREKQRKGWTVSVNSSA